MPSARRNFKTLALAVLTILGIMAVSRAGRDDMGGERSTAVAVSRAAADAAAEVRPSVVLLRALGKKRNGYGAGVIVSEDGLVLTARHVVTGATAIAVQIGDEEWPGELVATDRGADLALVRIVAPALRFAAVRWADESRVRVGETVFALGNPFGVGLSVSRGVLSARERRGVVPGNTALLLQTDAAVNPGSSGGPLVTLDGRVIGLITAILTRTGGHQGVAFAVPASEIMRSLPDLVAGRAVQRPWLGLRVSAVRDGLKVVAITPRGPAFNAGLKVGDLVVRSAATPLRDIGDLRRILSSRRAGAHIPLKIRRGDAVVTLDVETTYRRPENTANESLKKTDR